jgi:serine phosphatase RsbU (regulator of sigma subunit)
MEDATLIALESTITSIESPIEKVDALNELANEIRNSNTKRSIALSKQAHDLAQEINYSDGIATALSNEAFCYVQITDYDLALEKLFVALPIFEANNNQKGIAQVHYNFCLVYIRFSDYSMALDSIFKALNYYEKTSLKIETSRCLFQVGYLYYMLNEFSSAIDYYNRSIELSREIGNKTTEVTSLMGLGMLYNTTKEHDKSRECLLESMNIREAIKDWRGYAASLHAYMTLCMDTEQFEEAKAMCYKGIEMVNELGDKMGFTRFMLDLGKIQLKQNEVEEAEKTITEALVAAEKIHLKMTIAPAHALLAEIYEKKGNSALALQHYKQFHHAHVDMQNTNALLKAKSIELLAKIESAQNEAEINRFKNIELKNAFDEIEDKNKEILKSINYAKRIQTALLPPPRIVKEYLKNSFVLYIPKDIVAGDFYWIENTDQKIFFAACDCTGHGVPGAMVSVVCNNALNRSINEFGERLPGKIFDKTRELVLEYFAKSDEEVKDGMDASLAVLDVVSRKLLWSGANIPLWIIKAADENISESERLIEIKPNKQPIGRGYEAKPFTTHELQLNEGDIIYLCTDGYADQFGGERGKKMTKAVFRKILLELSHLPMDAQHKALLDYFDAYKGNEEQLDDVCVVGVKV